MTLMHLPETPTDRKMDTALRSDSYTYAATWPGVAYVCFIIEVFNRWMTDCIEHADGDGS